LSEKNNRIGVWAWSLPAAFVAHVMEEAFGGDGLTQWMADGGGADFSIQEFLGLNLAGAVTLALAAWASRRWRAWRWPLVAGAAVFISNGIWHAAICVMARSYIPGVLTGVLVYIPVGCLVVYRLWRLLSPPVFISAALAGLAIHGATIWIVLRMPGFQIG